MIFAFVFWRSLVFLKSGEVSILRSVTGLNLHHYHYGIFLIFISSLIFIFYKVEKYSVALLGFGFGSFFDGLVSRLLGLTARIVEINDYSRGFFPTVLLFGVLILFCVNIYLFFRRKV